jgi:hypothetical protein
MVVLSKDRQIGLDFFEQLILLEKLTRDPKLLQVILMNRHENRRTISFVTFHLFGLLGSIGC